jgi:hypothetical protein
MSLGTEPDVRTLTGLSPKQATHVQADVRGPGRRSCCGSKSLAPSSSRGCRICPRGIKAHCRRSSCCRSRSWCRIQARHRMSGMVYLKWNLCLRQLRVSAVYQQLHCRRSQHHSRQGMKTISQTRALTTNRMQRMPTNQTQSPGGQATVPWTVLHPTWSAAWSFRSERPPHDQWTLTVVHPTRLTQCPEPKALPQRASVTTTCLPARTRRLLPIKLTRHLGKQSGSGDLALTRTHSVRTSGYCIRQQSSLLFPLSLLVLQRTVRHRGSVCMRHTW